MTSAQIIGGTKNGDIYEEFRADTPRTFAVGIDSDDADTFKITTDAAYGVNPSSGTTVFEVDTAGLVSLPTNLLTNHGVLLAGAGGLVKSLGSATDGQLVIGSNGADPVLSTLTAGTGIGIANGTGSITISAGSTTPTSFVTDAGTATPLLNVLDVLGGTGINTAGGTNVVTVNLDVPVTVANGGTGLTTITDGHVMLGSGTGAVTPLNTSAKGSIIAGTGLTDPGVLTFGTNTYVLTADSTQTHGMKWNAPGWATTLTGDSGGALTPTAGNWNILGGTNVTVAGAGSTLTVNATNYTLTGDTGGALSPTAGNWNVLGGTNVTVTGSGSSLTIDSTGGGSGSWVFLNSQTASGATSVDFTSIIDDTYNVYKVIWHEAQISTDSYLKLLISTDNGATYEITSYDSAYFYYSTSSSFLQRTRITNGLMVSGLFFNTAGDQTGGEFSLFGMRNSSYHTAIRGGSVDGRNGVSYSVNWVTGAWKNTTVVDAIRIIPFSGTMSGTFSLYGLKES
jgi:hypothetical protein